MGIITAADHGVIGDGVTDDTASFAPTSSKRVPSLTGRARVPGPCFDTLGTNGPGGSLRQ